MIQHFTLPLSPEAFTDALHKGLGRAMQHARTCGLAGLEQIVIDACLHDHAYDPQLEDQRADWLMNMIFSAKSQDRIVPELLSHLADPCDDYRDSKQRSQIALGLTHRGIGSARPIVYTLLRKSRTSDVSGDEEIIALDGAEGLIHVANFLGVQLEQDPEFYAYDIAMRSFDDFHGEAKARHILDAAAFHSAAIVRYLKHVDDLAQRHTESAVDDEANSAPARTIWYRNQSAESTIAEIRRTDSRYSPFLFTEWGRCVPAQQLVPVFNAMLTEIDTARLCKYLRVFQKAKLPTFESALLQYSDHFDESVRRLANSALSNYRHADVHSLARSRIAQGRFTENEIELLYNNFAFEDAESLERHIALPVNNFAKHSSLFDLITLFQKNTVAECRNLMIFAYDNTPCSDCRRYAIEILLKTQQAPEWIIQECRDDAAKSIRDLFSPPLEPANGLIPVKSL